MENTRKYVGAAALACLALCIGGLAVAGLLGASAAALIGLCTLDIVIVGAVATLAAGLWLWRRNRARKESLS